MLQRDSLPPRGRRWENTQVRPTCTAVKIWITHQMDWHHTCLKSNSFRKHIIKPDLSHTFTASLTQFSLQWIVAQSVESNSTAYAHPHYQRTHTVSETLVNFWNFLQKPSGYQPASDNLLPFDQ
jgi:hypothetical protein